MKKRAVISYPLLALLHLPFIVGAWQPDISDFNRDGFVDTLRCRSSSGSGFATYECVITDGKNGETFALNSGGDDDGCFCSMRHHIRIPVDLLEPDNSGFKLALEKAVLPTRAERPDPSLQWILDGLQQRTTLANDSLYDYQFESALRWQPLPVEIPGDYFVEIADSLGPRYLVYGGSLHYRNAEKDTFELRIQRDSLILRATKHGIVLEKNNKYAWIFVTDHILTDSPANLRWPSVGFMSLTDYILRLHHQHGVGEQQIYQIDLRTGYCRREKRE